MPIKYKQDMQKLIGQLKEEEECKLEYMQLELGKIIKKKEIDEEAFNMLLNLNRELHMFTISYAKRIFSLLKQGHEFTS